MLSPRPLIIGLEHNKEEEEIKIKYFYNILATGGVLQRDVLLHERFRRLRGWQRVRQKYNIILNYL